MKTFPISNSKLNTFSIFYEAILFLSICFSRFLVVVPLKALFAKNIESLGKKIKSSNEVLITIINFSIYL